MRLSLNSYQAVPYDDPTVQNFVDTVHFSDDGELTFVPQAHDEEWSARIVRHKIRRAYALGRQNYIATVSKIYSYEIEADDLKLERLKQGELTIGGHKWKEHFEIEVGNHSYR